MKRRKTLRKGRVVADSHGKKEPRYVLAGHHFENRIAAARHVAIASSGSEIGSPRRIELAEGDEPQFIVAADIPPSRIDHGG